MATMGSRNFVKTGGSCRLDEIQATPTEVEAFGQALKNPGFRAMLCDYVKEVQDPANRETYISEMTRLEAARGNHVTFLAPKPGYVIKTRVLSDLCEDVSEDLKGLETSKVFVNVCADDNVQDAYPVFDKRDEQGRIAWAVPHSTSKPRRDVDKAGQQCMVFDVIFHPNVIDKSGSDFQFRSMVNNTALDGLETTFGIKLDRKRLRFPKLKFKGSCHLTVIRRPLSESEKANLKDLDQTDKEGLETILERDLDKDEAKSPFTPKYTIKYRYDSKDLPTKDHPDPTRPDFMVTEISLPELSSAKGIDLDVLEHLMTLECKEPVAYKLVLKLPYPVHEDQGSAKFDKTMHSLVVTLPIKPKDSVSRLVSIDSGIGLEFDEEEQSDNKTPRGESDGCEDLSEGLDEDLEDLSNRSMPPYICHIYEGLMVITLGVNNVVADSLTRRVLDKPGQGFQLTFHTLGQGFVPMHYGFCLSFDTHAWTLDDLEVEVWDNNMILQLSLPKACQMYQVGCNPKELGQAVALPKLSAVKEKCYLLGKKNGNVVKSKTGDNDLDSDDSCLGADSLDKSRHSSGDSNDSAVSVSSPTKAEVNSPSQRFVVIPHDLGQGSKDSNVRGILKRRSVRCLSESGTELLRMMSSASSTSSTIAEEDLEESSIGSKKSVRFNEVVQRQVYRTNSSILGQKHKNQKKAEQKRRRAAARRASEGDTPSSLNSNFGTSADENDNEDSDEAEAAGDSGLSMDEKLDQDKKAKTKSNSKKVKGQKRSKVAARFMEQGHHHDAQDLIFNLDF